MFENILVRSINELPQNDKLYKIIKSYNQSRELTENEKGRIIGHITKQYLKMYDVKMYNEIMSKISKNPE